MHDQLCTKFGHGEATRRFGKLLVALSYRWLQAAHPDPDSFHLKIVGNAAHLYIKNDSKSTGLRALVFEPLGRSRDVDFALFWDFASIYQRTRTAEQEDLFIEGLKASNIWYGHRHTVMWMQSMLPQKFDTNRFPTYAGSGWCYVEANLSSVLKPAALRLDLGQRDGHGVAIRPKVYDDFLKNCVVGRVPPVPPEDAAHALRTEKVFTARSDVERVVGLYEHFFASVAPTVGTLELSGLNWVDADAYQMARVLPRFEALASVDISANSISGSGGKAIIEALLSRTECTLIKNKFDTESAKMLIEMAKEKQIMLSGLKRDQTEADLSNRRLSPADGILISSDLICMSVLRKIVLSDNGLMDEGAIAIIESLKINTSLEELALRECGIGPGGGKAIARALSSSMPVLKSIDLRNNTLGREGWCAIFHALRDNEDNKIESWAFEEGPLDCEVATSLAEYMSVTTVLTECDMSRIRWRTRFGPDSKGEEEAMRMARLFAKIAAEKGIMLSGIKHDQKEAHPVKPSGTEYRKWNVTDRVCHAILVESDLRVSAVLTECEVISDYEVHRVEPQIAKAMAEIGTEKRIMLSGMKRDETEANFYRCDALEDISCVLIASDLSFMSALKTLILSRHDIGDRGAIALCESLARNDIEINKSLETIWLVSCNIQSEGGKAIGAALQSGLAVLTSLDLAGNRIGFEGAKAIADALKSGAAALKKLNIKQNRLDPEGTKALRVAVEGRDGFKLGISSAYE